MACRECEAARRDAETAQAAAAAAANELSEFRTAADERQRRFHMLNSGFKKKEEGLTEELAAARDAAAAAQEAAEAAAARLAYAEEVGSARAFASLSEAVAETHTTSLLSPSFDVSACLFRRGLRNLAQNMPVHHWLRTGLQQQVDRLSVLSMHC